MEDNEDDSNILEMVEAYQNKQNVDSLTNLTFIIVLKGLSLNPSNFKSYIDKIIQIVKMFKEKVTPRVDPKNILLKILQGLN